MNWQVAEAALFHGGGSSGYCEDEMEKEMAAYAEHLRRRKTEAKVEGEHADDSAAMAAEHRSMRERERQAGLARVEAERKENQESTSLVGQQFGLPPELSEATFRARVLRAWRHICVLRLCVLCLCALLALPVPPVPV